MAPEPTGPMGWGVDEIDNTPDHDKRLLDELQEKEPALFAPHDPKPVMVEAVDRLRELMAADHIANGVDLRYLEVLAFGKTFQWLPQKIGSCVASGGMRAICLRTLAEILIHGQLETTFGESLTGPQNIATFAPWSYRMGRKLGGLNRGDGSFCGSHIDGLRRGMLPCHAPGLRSDAFPEPQSMQLYRQWGNSNELLDRFADVASKWQLLESQRLTSAEQFKTECAEKFCPAMICSLWAFEPDHKHSSWYSDRTQVTIYRRSRQQWAHNMTLCGCVEVAGKWFVIVRNSWGNMHNGRDWFPIPLDLLDDWLRDRNTVSMTIGELDLPDLTVGS